MENDELAKYLDALARDDCYRVERVLKRNPHEITEVVYFQGASPQGSAEAKLGPFIRKRINNDAPLGSAYQTLFDAQRAGKRFLHLPRIYDVHDRGDEAVVIMEYVVGSTLHDEVYRKDASLDLAQTWFPLLCDGVIELHEGFMPPIIHRDLKPSNIIINENGLTIIDLGIARSFRDDADHDTMQFGTRAYAPPEQFGYGQTDERSDVYALGLILNYMLTEQNPTAELIRNGFSAVPYAELRAVMQRATAFDPKDRYQSVCDLKDAFLCASEAITSQSAPVVGSYAVAVPRSASPTPAAPLPSSVVPRDRVSVSSSRVPEALGVIWNVLVALAWLIFSAACVYGTIDPDNVNPRYPLLFRGLMFMICVESFFSAIAYALLDKRILRRRIALMKDQTFTRGLILSGKIILGSVLLFIVLAVIAAVLYPSV